MHTATSRVNFETIVLAAGLSVFAAFITAFGLSGIYVGLLAGLTTIAGTFGINILTGPAFRNLFHVPQGVLVVVSLGLFTVQTLAPTWGLGGTWTKIVMGVVAMAYTLGFGTTVTPATARRIEAS